MISAEDPNFDRFLARHGGKVGWAAVAVLSVLVVLFFQLEGF
jgi:hypothetical protein